jgi:hypothetical protein
VVQHTNIEMVGVADNANEIFFSIVIWWCGSKVPSCSS